MLYVFENVCYLCKHYIIFTIYKLKLKYISEQTNRQQDGFM